MHFDWDNPVKHQHPNWFLRLYGNFMGAIAHWFLAKSLPYATTFEITSFEDEEEMWDLDFDWDKLNFEYKRWKGDNNV